MQVIYQNSYTNVDLSQVRQFISITTNANMVLMMKVVVDGIAGTGGNYTCQLFLNSIIIVPDRPIPVDAAIERFCLESRQVVVLGGETLDLYLQGLGGDTNVTVTITVINASPVLASEIIDSVGEPLIASVIDAIGNHDIIVKPERTVLGACPRPITPMPKIAKCR